MAPTSPWGTPLADSPYPLHQTQKAYFAFRQNSFRDIQRRFEQCRYKLEWRYALQGQPFKEKKLLKSDTPPFSSIFKTANDIPDGWPALQYALREFTSLGLSIAREISSAPRSSKPRCLVNVWGGLRRRGECTPLSDKDGTFVVGDCSLVDQMTLQELAKNGTFVKCNDNEPNDYAPTALARLKPWVQGLEEISKRWAGQCRTSLEALDASKCCNLLVKVKTHKEPPGIRLILSSTNLWTNACSEVVNRLIGPWLYSKPHLCKDSSSLHAPLARLRLPPRSCFMKFDVDSFFFAGKHEQLAVVASSIIGDKLHSNFALFFQTLLPFQYVHHPRLGTFRSTRVPGIGHRHSSCVADASFYALVEKNFSSIRSSGGFDSIEDFVTMF